MVVLTAAPADILDFDTLTDPGGFGCLAATNSPTSLHLLEWAVAISVGAFGNIYQVAAPSINPWAQWARRYTNGAWTAWTPIGGVVAPEHYGASGVYDETVGDKLFIQAAFQSGFPVKLIGVYNLDGVVNCGSGFGNKDVHVSGSSKEHFRVSVPSGTIRFYTGPATVQTGLRCTFRDFTMVCATDNHADAAIAILGPWGVSSGSTIKNFDIYNVQFFSSDNTKGFPYGVNVNNGRNGSIRGCVHQGNRNLPPGSRQGAGFWLSGDADPVDIIIDDCKSYFCQYGMLITGTVEGTRVVNCVAVGCDRGLLADVSESPMVGRNTGKQLLLVDNCHFNCFLTGIYTCRVWDIAIQGTSILLEAPHSNGQGIFLHMEGDIGLRARIDCCAIQDRTPGAPSWGTTIGINVSNSNSAIGTMVRVTNTIFDSIDAGIYAQPGASDIKYDANSCQFINCGAATGGNVAGITGY